MYTSIRDKEDRTIHEGEFKSFSECLVDAVEKRKSLRGVCIQDEVIENVNLYDVDFSNAYIRNCIIQNSSIAYSNFHNAIITYSNIKRTSMYRCMFYGSELVQPIIIDSSITQSCFYNGKINASFNNTVLSGTSFNKCTFTICSFKDTDIRKADLSAIRNDVIHEILKTPFELEFLRDHIIKGRIKGNVYSGECCCLAGTIYKSWAASNTPNAERGLFETGSYTDEFSKVTRFTPDPNTSRELWFLGIKEGNTPENSVLAAITLEWVDEAIRIRDNIYKQAAEETLARALT